MLGVIKDILLLTIAIFVVAKLLPGIRIKSFGTAVLVAVVYSVVHFFLYRILTILTFPFILLTFGLFVFIINAALLYLTSKLVSDFKLAGFGTTLLASLLISLCSVVLRSIF